MKWTGISLARMMLVVAIIAADFGLWRFWEGPGALLGDEGDEGVLIIGLLPMANIIALGLPRLLWLGLPRLFRRVRRMPFAIGFQATSWASTLAVLAIYVVKFETVIDCLVSSMPGLGQTHCVARIVSGSPVEPLPVGFFESCRNAFLNSVDLDMLVEMAEIMAFFSLPPLLVSLAGGLLTRIFVRRRARAAIVSRLPAVVA